MKDSMPLLIYPKIRALLVGADERLQYTPQNRIKTAAEITTASSIFARNM